MPSRRLNRWSSADLPSSLARGAVHSVRPSAWVDVDNSIIASSRLRSAALVHVRDGVELRKARSPRRSSRLAIVFDFEQALPAVQGGLFEHRARTATGGTQLIEL